LRFQDQNHRYSTLEGKTPLEKMTDNLKYLPRDFKLPLRLGISAGYVHLLRFIMILSWWINWISLYQRLIFHYQRSI